MWYIGKYFKINFCELMANAKTMKTCNPQSSLPYGTY